MNMTKRNWIFLVIILALIAVSSIVMFINAVTYKQAHSVEAKIKQEFYSDETIISNYDGIITYKIERVPAWQPDEDLPKDVRSGCYTIHILALIEEDRIVIDQYYLCVVFYKVKLDILGLHRDEILLDCDFTRIRKCDFEKIAK